MRSRSSRLFIVLIHVIGVPNHLHRLGVHPDEIILETLDLRHGLVDGGTTSTYTKINALLQREQLLEPFWLQDLHDNTCLGPNGFTDCGDATLWYIQSKPRKRCVLFCESLQQHYSGYALKWEGKQNKCFTSKGLSLGRCRHAWTWKFNSQGNLIYDPGQRRLERSTQCVHRNINNATLVLDDCSNSRATRQDLRRIHFSLVRPTTATATTQHSPLMKTKTQEDPIVSTIDLAAAAKNTTNTTIDTSHIANTKDLAHSQASLPLSNRFAQQQQPQPKTRTATARSTNPKLNKKVTAPITRKDNPKSGHHHTIGSTKSSHLFMDPSPSSEEDDVVQPFNTPLKVRRTMTPPNPYIAASKNGIYTDPQTGLEYPTDLVNYLGETKKQSGRHTLMGVGQYTKTVFHIKVYGVALYISKRDALQDSLFRKFASLSSAELAQRPDFYSHLRTMSADRTLLLKLNMQLSTETMRSSLQADWKLLTEERKELLLSCSMRPIPAEERMLQTISTNAGRCSCGQVAPDEYHADPTCCARGTELVFTWRKNGNLEVRLDGRILDIFPRPDIAHGIFYEYLRYDAPISLDFKEHAVDGFPFLLAPLAQVRDLPPSPHTTTKPPQVQKGSDLLEWVHVNANAAASNVLNVAKSMGESARGVAEELDRKRDVLLTQVSSMPEAGKAFLAEKVPQYSGALASSVTNWLRSKKHQNTVIGPYIGGVPGRGVSWFREDVLPDKPPVVIQATGSLGQQMFVWMVHLYLLLLLIVSLPGSNTLVTRRRSQCTAIFDTESDASTTSSSDEDLPSPRRRDPEQSKLENDKTAAFLSRRKNIIGESETSATTKMKKSLSYFL